MPKPSQRTRSKKRKPSKLPGKGAVIHYKRERVGGSHCGKCGRLLPSIPRMIPSKLRSLTASKKRLQRIYGGRLCHICLKEALKQAARSNLPS